MTKRPLWVDICFGLACLLFLALIVLSVMVPASRADFSPDTSFRANDNSRKIRCESLRILDDCTTDSARRITEDAK